MPNGADKPRTVGELRSSGYTPQTVKQEVRKNLIQKIENADDLFPGIVGFDESVIPQLENALLAGQDIILLGERGQAKSRLIRHLVSLLDDEIPVMAGCELNDDPFAPICRACKQKVEEQGDEAAIQWMSRDMRYSEKLATPDISVADLIGEIDPIKVAEGRYLSDELTIHYGLIPRTNRGIFCINELPDLSERIQVGLFNLMEERDVQIKGYRVMLPLDLMLVSSANPEDYTNRGRIVTPLKDRFGAQIRTHYPRSLDQEIDIVEQEYVRFPDTDERVTVPAYMKEIVAEITSLARRSPEVNQRSGVSLRVSISNYETMLGNAFKRSVEEGSGAASPPRPEEGISDLPAANGGRELIHHRQDRAGERGRGQGVQGRRGPHQEGRHPPTSSAATTARRSSTKSQDKLTRAIQPLSSNWSGSRMRLRGESRQRPAILGLRRSAGGSRQHRRAQEDQAHRAFRRPRGDRLEPQRVSSS